MRHIAVILFAAVGLHAQYSGFSPANLDKSADPCTNFFQYACGTWVRNNPIPADRARWSRFEELSARNESILRDILETSAAKQNGTAVERKIGDYYTACLDERAIDAKGIAPLKLELDRIAAVKDKSSLTDALVRIHLNGSSAFFNLYSRADLSNSDVLMYA